MDTRVILAEGLDVSMFRSLDGLVGHVEAQDVRDGIYEAFDAHGHLIELAAPSDRGPISAVVREYEGERLRAILIAYVDAVGRKGVGLTMPNDPAAREALGSLIDYVWAFQQAPRRRWWGRRG